MFLGTAHISKLPNFILGYQFCSNISQKEQDFYFGEKGFIKWYAGKYNPEKMSFWHDYFLKESNNDESEALALYFTRLEEYYNWYNANMDESRK